MSRWSAREHQILSHIRSTLREEIAATGQFVEVVGDRALIKFIRGHGHNEEKATLMYKNYLKWRKDNNLDAIRQEIVLGGKRPLDFPFASRFITDCGHQIIISSGMRDTQGNPIAIETYGYNPQRILDGMTNENYSLFMVSHYEFLSCFT